MYPIDGVMEFYLRRRHQDYVIKVVVNDDLEYGADAIVDFAIENSLSMTQELELGTVIPNQLTIRMRTRQELPPNAKIVPYIAINTGSLTWEEAAIAWQDANMPWDGSAYDWLPLGEFYVDSREYGNDVWRYVCLDKLIFGDVPYVSGLSYPASMQAVWNELCSIVGVTDDSSVQINPAYTIPVGPTGYSVRTVMQYICSAHAACAYLGKDGVLRWKQIKAADAPVYALTDSDYSRVKETNPLKTYSRVVVQVDPDDENAVYVAGTGTDAQTFYVQNPFGTQQIADDMLAAIDGFAYQPVSLSARGFPHLDQGDVLQVAIAESLTWEMADIAWQDADIPWDGIVHKQTIILHQEIRYQGGLSMQIEAPSISEQQSEFKVEGALTQAVNRLNRTSVKLGKPYYGLWITHEEGLRIARSDGKSDLKLNSDVMDWKVNGESTLYLDTTLSTPLLKFGGHLEAATGSFSGEITAASGMIGGWAIAPTGLSSAAPGVYPRIDLSSAGNLLRAAFSASKYVEIIPLAGSDPGIRYLDGAATTFLIQSGNNFMLTSPQNISITGAKVAVYKLAVDNKTPLGSYSQANSAVSTVEGMNAFINDMISKLRFMGIFS